MESKNKILSAVIASVLAVSSLSMNILNVYSETLPVSINEIVSETSGESDAAVISAPVFSHNSGFYGTDFALNLSAENGTTIYYTTDGSDPTSSDTAQVYSEEITVVDRTNQPNIYSKYAEDDTAVSITNGIGYKAPSFNVDKATVVRAAAKSKDGTYSKTVSQTYFITNGNLAKYEDMTVVSLVTNPDNLFDPDKGIYVVGNQFLDWKNSSSYDPDKSVWDTDNVTNYFSRGKAWEREADITVFSNGSPVVEQGMGIRIKGSSTRNQAHKSFNLYARSEYGASKIKYPLIPDNYDKDGNLIKKYDSISLRAISDHTRLNDSFVQILLSDRENLSTQAMKPCVVFLNGEYWGLYEITERFSDYYFETKYGINKDDITMLKEGECEEGSQEECDALISFADEYSAKDLSAEENYNAVCDVIDIDSMIDHYAAGIYLGTFDWPNHNYGMWKSTGQQIEGNKYSDGKWRFMSYDLDYTIGLTYEDFGGVEGYAYDSFKHMEKRSDAAPTNLFVSLLKNKDFRDKFAAVYCDYANEVAKKDKGIALAEKYSSDYADILARSSTRWWGYFGGDAESTYRWNVKNYQSNIISDIKTFFTQRENYTLEDMKSYLGYSGELQTITIKSGEHGRIQINSIIPDTGTEGWSGKYYSDCPVTLTAIPDEGYSFAGWGGDVSGSETTITVTPEKAMSILADFETSFLRGDVNADGKFNSADVVLLQKWLSNFTGEELTNWIAADLCEDKKLNVFDVCMMRSELQISE